MIYQISGGSKSFGTLTLFENIQFQVKSNEKIALIGRNGTGKSTLLKIICGQEEPDSGEIHKAADLRIGYLRQNAFADPSKPVRAEFERIYAPLIQLKQQLDEVTERMSQDSSEAILNKYATLEQRYEEAGGYTYESERRTVFTRFGFCEEDMDRPIDSFSGGQRTRLAFVCLLLEKPDILLLDEPTNHLDVETIEWLEKYLKSYSKAVIVASHDRMFMDHLVNEVYELDHEELVLWHGNYSSYLEQKKADKERQQRAYDQQQKDIKRLEALIEKFRYKTNKAAFAQSKIKYLERMDKIDAPQNEKKNFAPRFTVRLKGGKRVLETKDLVIGYDHPLCTINLEVLRGQRIAIIGPNGQGKSTFVKTIVGLVPQLSGEYMFGHQIEPGYFDQELAQFNDNKTVLDELWDDYPDLDRTEIRTVLGNFLFSADDVFKEVGVLSGGEKVRLSLAKLMLKQANLLILDEPTNHLDIPGKEALEKALKDYEGTLLLVSHDRWLIQTVATSLLIIENGQAVYYPYTYLDYVDGLAMNGSEPQKSDEKKEKNGKPIRRFNWDKEVRRLEQAVTDAENELKELQQKRFDPEIYNNFKKAGDLEKQIQEQQAQVEELEKQWEEAMTHLDQED